MEKLAFTVAKQWRRGNKKYKTPKCNKEANVRSKPDTFISHLCQTKAKY